jgi:hypothetical protein
MDEADPDKEYRSKPAAMESLTAEGTLAGAGRATGPLGLEEANAPGDQPPPDWPDWPNWPNWYSHGPITRKLGTIIPVASGEYRIPSGDRPLLATRYSLLATGISLLPVAHSPVHLVMKRRGWREVLRVLSGLLIIMIVAAFLLAGLVVQQEYTAPTYLSFAGSGPFVLTPAPPDAKQPSPVQNNARGGDNAGPLAASTRLPTISGPTQTPIVSPTTTPALPGIEK